MDATSTIEAGRPWADQARPISILFTPNANYAQHMAACIASLLQQSDAQLEIVVASSQDPAVFSERISRSFAGSERVSLEFKQFQFPAGTPFPVNNKNLSLDMYLRFWAHELLLPGRARALYLDPDIIAVGPLDELWRTDLRGKALGAVPIPNSQRVTDHGMPTGSLYFNSGVLLFDLEAWRSRCYAERCLQSLRENAHRLKDPDQDILNLTLIGDWLPLDYKWNVINPFYRPSYDLGLPPGEVERVLEQARLIHFNGSKKPWFYLDNHPRRAEYLRSLAETDWRDWRPSDLTPLNVVRKQLSLALPERVKAVGRTLLRLPG